MSRAVTTSAGPVRVGELVDWTEGVETAPGPDGYVVRQVAHGEGAWSSTTWISADGAAFQRIYDPFSSRWLWYGPKTYGCDADRTFRVSVGTSTGRRSLAVARAIALAWISVPGRRDRKWHAVQVFEGPLSAETVGWVTAGTKPLGRAPAAPLPAVRPRADDEWAPLEYVWFSPAGDVERVLPRDSGYAISRRGWLRAPSGNCTQGVLNERGERWASVRGEALIGLAEAVLRSFGSNPVKY